MQGGTQAYEVAMTEADEDRRKDEDTGKVTTYAELLAEHDYNSELAAVAWDVMTPVSGGTDTPSGAMGGRSLGGDQATQQQQQQAAEIRKYRQQQAAKKEADEAAAKAATQAPKQTDAGWWRCGSRSRSAMPLLRPSRR